MSKIDRMVGIKVFGWSIVAASDSEPIWSNDCGTPLAFQYASAPVKFGPNFSTDIAAAWEVVEQFVGPRFNERALVLTLQEEYGWECTIGAQDGDERGSIYATDKSAPMAICLAALKACDVPESEIQEAMR